MSAMDIFQRAQAAGVTITATPAGSLELCGPSESIRTLAPEVRTHKEDILRHFADPRHAASARMQAPAPEVAIPRRLWLVHHADGRWLSHAFTPPASREEVAGWYPLALELEPEDDATNGQD